MAEHHESGMMFSFSVDEKPEGFNRVICERALNACDKSGLMRLSVLARKRRR